MQFVRWYSAIPRQHPFVLRDLGERTSVALSSSANAVPLGSFKTAVRPQMEAAFTKQKSVSDDFEPIIANPQLFEENPDFWPVASEILRQHVHLDEAYGDLVAAETRTRYFHIYDFRLPPMFGRIPEVEDILGTVELDIQPRETTIIPMSFQPNAMYRPLTRYGAMLLAPYSHEMIRAHAITK